jgi:hypothetical protein
VSASSAVAFSSGQFSFSQEAAPTGLSDRVLKQPVPSRKLPGPLSARAEAFSRSLAGPLRSSQVASLSPPERPNGSASEQKENTMSSPAHKIRDGALQVVIWRNMSTSGQTYYTVNPIRSYKQGEETWKETDSLNADDLLAMAELLREAYAWIKAQRKADAKGLRESQQVTK